MRRTLTRQELYDWLWEVPASAVAAQLGISRISLVRICRRANIPLPDRAYRGLKRLGRALPRPPLPPRELGQHAELAIGRGPTRTPSDIELLVRPLPAAPVFEGDERTVRASISALIRHVPVPRTFAYCHREVDKLLEADAARSARGLRPLLASRMEMRRLRLLNALFNWAGGQGFACKAVAPLGLRASITVRDQAVPFAFARWGEPDAAHDENAPMPEDAVMCLKLIWWQPPPEVRLEWVDDDRHPLEAALTEVAREIVFAAEWGYRWRILCDHARLVERRAKLEGGAGARRAGQPDASTSRAR
jgi:hypothetical protein